MARYIRTRMNSNPVSSKLWGPQDSPLLDLRKRTEDELANSNLSFHDRHMLVSLQLGLHNLDKSIDWHYGRSFYDRLCYGHENLTQEDVEAIRAAVARLIVDATRDFTDKSRFGRKNEFNKSVTSWQEQQEDMWKEHEYKDKVKLLFELLEFFLAPR